MRVVTRAVLMAVCAAATALAVVPPAQAAPTAASGCTYYYTSWGRGPNGQTTGSGYYPEGTSDPEGRVCQNGWWVDPNEGQYDTGYGPY